MDALFAKGKEFLSSKNDKETSNHRERTKRHDDEDDSDDRPERKNSDHHGDKPAAGGSGGGKMVASGAGLDAHNPNEHKQPTTSELMASAKLLAATAQSQLGGGGGEGKPKEALDTGKLAGAAADILSAASHYGKFGEEGIGKYIGQAEDCLHGYELKNSKPNKAAGSGSSAPRGNSTKSRDDDDDDEHREPIRKEDRGKPMKQAGGDYDHERLEEDDRESGGGYGDYLKKAQGTFAKKSGDGDESPRGEDRRDEGGMGGTMKMAQGMFKKDSGDHGHDRDRDRSLTRD